MRLLLILFVLITMPGVLADEGGNSLSVPVIWSDGSPLAIPGTFGEVVLEGSSTDVNGSIWYWQGDPDNSWQAENIVANETTEVSFIDWGDNLEAKSWPEGSVVRVETVLQKELSEPMIGYEMLHLSGHGVDELWASNGQTYDSSLAHVYSGCARLVIQKLELDRDNESLDVTWNSEGDQWVGTIEEPLFSAGVWDSVEGPGGYAAEINVQGKIIYGYNWFVKDIEDPVGDYRLTFVIDEDCEGAKTSFENTQIAISEEETEETEEDTSSPDLGGGTPEILPEHTLTFIDVRITEKDSGDDHDGDHGGGSGGSGGQGGDHGSNHTPKHNHDSTYLPLIESLEDRSVKNKEGVSIYLGQGWSEFRLPWFVLAGTSQTNALAVEDYTVESVLESIEGKYEYIAFFDGEDWQTYVPENMNATTFTEFPIAATTKDNLYHIYMTSGGRLEIDEVQ